jgi:integrase
MRNSFKSKTVEHYDLVLKKWIPQEWYNREILNFTKAYIEETIFRIIGSTATPNTQRDVHRRISRIFEMAVEEGLLAKNPAIGIKVKVPEAKQLVLNSNEVEILLREGKETNHRFYSVWVMAVMTGMRSGEMYGLRWSDIDFDTEMISVTRQWTSKDGLHPTKNGRNRLVALHPSLKQFLAELKLKGGYTETLFDGVIKTNVTHDDYVLPRLKEWKDGLQAQVLGEFCEACGLTKIKFHDLRATFITNLLSNGESLVKVMAVVGHSRMATTDRYVRLSGVAVKNSTKKLSYSIPQSKAGEIISIDSWKAERGK